MTSFTYGTPTLSGPATTLAQLCALDHTDFVRCAYLTVLGRQPDAEGMNYYIERWTAGVSKLTMLSQLRTSLEAASHDPGIAGFDRALRRHRLGNLPLIGWLMRFFYKAEADNRKARRERATARQLARIEARLLATHIDCIDRLEEVLLIVRTIGRGAAAPSMAYSGGSGSANETTGLPREFGLARVGGRMAVPWSEIKGGR